jgi:hypothetical protein
MSLAKTRLTRREVAKQGRGQRIWGRGGCFQAIRISRGQLGDSARRSRTAAILRAEAPLCTYARWPDVPHA